MIKVLHVTLKSYMSSYGDCSGCAVVMCTTVQVYICTKVCYILTYLGAEEIRDCFWNLQFLNLEFCWAVFDRKFISNYKYLYLFCHIYVALFVIRVNCSTFESTRCYCLNCTTLLLKAFYVLMLWTIKLIWLMIDWLIDWLICLYKPDECNTSAVAVFKLWGYLSVSALLQETEVGRRLSALSFLDERERTCKKYSKSQFN